MLALLSRIFVTHSRYPPCLSRSDYRRTFTGCYLLRLPHDLVNSLGKVFDVVGVEASHAYTRSVGIGESRLGSNLLILPFLVM